MYFVDCFVLKEEFYFLRKLDKFDYVKWKCMINMLK